MNLDRKSLIAIGLCVLLLVLYWPLLKWLGLDKYMKSTPANPVATVDTTRTHGSPGTPGKPTSPGAAMVPPAPGGEAALAALPLKPVASEIERSYRIETPLYHAEFSSRGARLLSVELLHYASAHGASSVNGKAVRVHGGKPIPAGDRVVLGGGPSFGIDLGSGSTRVPLADLVYAVAESSDAAGDVRRLTFTGRDSSGMEIRQTWRVRPDSYALDLEVEIHNTPPAWHVNDYSLTARSWPLFTESNLKADAQGEVAASLVGTNLHREHTPGLRKGVKRFEGNAEWAAVKSRYFMGAVVATEAPARAAEAQMGTRPLTPEQRALLPANAPPDQETAISSLVVGLPGETSPVHHFVVYFGPCEYFAIAKLGLQLERAVDLGWSWIQPFSRFLLKVMVWLERVVRNYGLAILALATLVRMLLHPLAMTSIKSMRAMQKIQPEVERLREKYKNDPNEMNTRVMALYKENKVNPAGGCLPMVLQMPLFFALYSVLWNAIELRQAPFVGWIHDLSAPDLLFSVPLPFLGAFPIRLLPILMAGSGFLTQRLTPTDPRQASSMYLMNVVMLWFFYSLPSGLVLYWTVMNLLTALQQWLALREDGPVSKAVVVDSGSKVARRAATK